MSGNSKKSNSAWSKGKCGGTINQSQSQEAGGLKKENVANGDLISQSQRFQEVCEQMRKNAAKFLENDKDVESSSEDEIDDSFILQKTLSQYSDDGQDLLKIREYLQDILTSGALVCLICIESIKRNDLVWSCHYCYGILHLSCIQKWAKDSLYLLSADSDERRKEWCCPKCRGEYVPSEQPQNYFCFCGKIENPVYDTWTVPHSCGKTCDKPLKPDCSHTCSLLCHPGPCPPCPKTVLVSCCCSKSKPVSRRCSNKEWSCGKICEKLLLCQLHFCEDICHKNSCHPCKKKSEQKCLCGKEIKLQLCESPEWQCNEVCGKVLECGNHSCLIVCHEGPCPICPNSGPRTCPCSKKVTSAPCTETIMPCGDTCNKILECGLHRCTQRCHFGPCEKCLQMRVMKCRCGQREKSVPCCKEFICDTKCKRLRDCGRHFCNRKCCIGQCPPCEVSCGKTLNCKSHKCSSVCHQGPCFPCKETVIITCNCGLTKIAVPCGRKKSTIPPRCSADCKLPSDCHHSQRHRHKCHFGTCPPCQLICGKTLNCSHICPVKCHSAVLMKVEMKEKKAGPWDLINSYKTKLVEKLCPPCKMPVPVACFGGHEVMNLFCYEANSRSCGRPCGRILQCGNHACQIECHKVSSTSDNNMQSPECEMCEEICQKTRKPGCTHPCLKPCHSSDCSPCKQHIKTKCHCDLNTLYIPCTEWIEADEKEKDKLKSCSNRCPKQMPCGHRCNYVCHKGECSTAEKCRKKVVLRCPCKRMKKEMHCFIVNTSQTVLNCDSECLKIQESFLAKQIENDLKLKEIEKRQQELEVQEFLRKLEGKKRRKKIITDERDSNLVFSKYFIVLSTVIIFISVFFLYYVLAV